MAMALFKLERKKSKDKSKLLELAKEDNVVLAGYVNSGVGAVIGLIVGIGVATLVLIFVGVIGGQTYQTAEAQINQINNTVVKSYVDSAITSGFKSLSLTGDYLPLVVLATIISVVLMTLFGVFGGGYGHYQGGVL